MHVTEELAVTAFKSLTLQSLPVIYLGNKVQKEKVKTKVRPLSNKVESQLKPAKGLLNFTSTFCYIRFPFSSLKPKNK